MGGFMAYFTGSLKKKSEKNWISGKENEKTNPDFGQRIAVAVTISIIGVVTLFLQGMLAFLQNNTSLALADLGVSLFLLINLLYFLKIGNYNFACYLAISAVGIFYFYLFVTGGVNNTAYVWLYTFPLFVFFLLGSSKGAVATLALFVPVVVFLFFDEKLPMLTTYSLDLKLRFVPSFLIVFFYAYLHENFVEKTHRVLAQSNEELERKVSERTADLQTALDLTASEVKARTIIEERLQKSQAALLMILDSLDAIVYATDFRTHEVLYMNQYARDLFGSGVGRKCWQVFQKNQRGPCTFCPNSELIDKSGHRKKISWEMKNTINGRWYDMRECVTDWVDGRVVKIQIAADITSRKLAEEKVLLAKKEWEITFDALAEPVFILNKDFVITRANKALSKKLGLEIISIVGRKCYELIHGSTAPSDQCPFHKLLQNGSCHSAEIFEGTLNGTFWVSVSPVVDVHGILQGGVHVMVDISERKQAEEEKNRLIEELQQAMAQIRRLEGIIPICSYCKRIRDDEGYWNQLEKYISNRSEARFSHSICEECAKKNFPELFSH
ncbi:MAG: PAS domain-containing protein [Thermodesulfobacteriota bacterium]